MPRTFDVVPDGEAWEYEPSILLDGEPELETDPTQVVTYRINGDAVWSDGEPITCADFAYTWDQIATGDDIYDTTGYVNIGAVECPDPKIAVVTFETPFAGWRSLFGGQYGVLPAHLLEGKDRNALMKDGYEFSGGPWLIEEWNRGTDVTLVPNDAYWGDLPKLDKVVFRFIPDTSAEFQAFKAGETDAIYPQPQLDAVEQIDAGIPGAQTYYTAVTGNLEALWMNNEVAPFDSRAVRQAFSYALDRDAIVERLFGGLGITEASQSFNAPIVGDFTDLEAFSGYTRDLDKVADLMEGDGWAKGGDGVWAKDGQRASVTFKTTAGNKRRELTQQIIQEQAKEAGFEVAIDNQEAGDLFGSQLPGGDFQLALYAQVLTSLDPSNCPLFCSENIPTADNGFSGQNWTRTNIPAVDPLLREVDTNLDDDARAAAQRQADGILAEEATSLPLDPLPNILMWSDRVVGPVGDNPIHGPFYNMHLWGLDG
jgi:peptide/nickel transport system substrate-binding protein